MSLECPLTELKDGESGTITSIKAGYGWEKGRRRGGRGWGLERRLADMGLTPGTRVTVVKSALSRSLRGSCQRVKTGLGQRYGR